MIGLLWTIPFWGIIFALLLAGKNRSATIRGWLRSENLALALALLGTHAVAQRTEAEEVLRDPLVFERVLRGGLATAAILIAAPKLIAGLRRAHLRFPGLAGVAVYLAICGLSVFYSAAPLVTAGKLFELTAGVVAVSAVALGHQPKVGLYRTLTFIILLEGSLLLISVIGFFVFPSSFAPVLSRPGFLTSATMASPFAHSNGLSATAALIAAFSFARILESSRTSQRIAWGLAFLLGTAGTLLASGRQGVVIWFLSILVLSFTQRRAISLLLVGPGLALVIVGFWDEIFTMFARGRPERLADLSGRVGWWEGALRVWLEHPWTGYGYGAGGRFVALESLGRSATSSLHNGYLEALVGVGILGLAPLMMVAFRIVRWAAGELWRRRNIAVAILIVPLLLRTSVSLGFGGWLNPDLILFICLTGLVDLQRQSRRTAITALPHPRHTVVSGSRLG